MRNVRCVLLASVLFSVATFQAEALTIVGNYVPAGSTFPHSGVVAETFSGVRNAGDLTTAPTQAALSTAAQNVFNVGSKYWARRFDDPWVLVVNYGFADLDLNFGAPPPTSGVLQVVDCQAVFAGSSVCRPTEVNLYSAPFRPVPPATTGGWYLDPSPMADEEYQPFTLLAADLGAGRINTGRYTAAAVEPPSTGASGPQCNGVPCGAYPDLMLTFLHELTHALNMYSETLRALDPNATISSTSGNIVIPHGPYAGSTIPWDSRGGGHARLPPSAPCSPPAGVTPCGLLMVDGDGHGEHRRLVVDADAVVIASVDDFKRVNLDTLSYVALPDFNDRSILTTSGSTQPSGAALQLTPDATGQAGKAFLTKPFIIGPGSSFDTRFAFRIGGTHGSSFLGADGLAFVIHNDPNAAAHGNAGEGLGFGTNDTGGNPFKPISPSVAVEFDTHQNAFDPDDNHVAVILDGKMRSHVSPTHVAPCSSADASNCLNNGSNVYVWITYAAKRLKVFVSRQATMPSVPTIDTTVDLLARLGEQIYFGFTASTGDGFNVHEVLAWDVAVEPNVAPSISGDVNGNGKADCTDVALVQAAFGRVLTDPAFDARADLNGDGVVNIRDLALVSQKLPPATRCP